MNMSLKSSELKALIPYERYEEGKQRKSNRGQNTSRVDFLCLCFFILLKKKVTRILYKKEKTILTTRPIIQHHMVV